MSDKITRWKKIMDISQKVTGCHQLPERSFFFRGYQFPMCSRCTGILVGYFISIILFSLNVLLPIWLCLLLCLFMAVDGTIQLLLCIMSNNIRRFITGLLYGIGAFSILLNIIIIIAEIVV